MRNPFKPMQEDWTSSQDKTTEEEQTMPVKPTVKPSANPADTKNIEFPTYKPEPMLSAEPIKQPEIAQQQEITIPIRNTYSAADQELLAKIEALELKLIWAFEQCKVNFSQYPKQ